MKVSILTITYNQEKFIGQTIESALMQETDFDFEIVIGEDCSTDHTREIILDYKRRFPDKIRLLLHEKNVGAYQNAVQTMSLCQGEYIAVLDGDDYWTSPHKLQKQVDFLDSHPDYAICFHNAQVTYEDGSKALHNRYPDKMKSTYVLEDILNHTYVLPVTVLFRNGLVDAELPEAFRNLPICDWLRFILLAQHGKIGYAGEVMGVYRIHSGGLFSHKGSIDDLIRMKLAQLESYEVVNKYLGYKYDYIMRERIVQLCYGLARAYEQIGNKKMMRKYSAKGFRAHPVGAGTPYRYLLHALLVSIVSKKFSGATFA